jgi:hypothetical protein
MTVMTSHESRKTVQAKCIRRTNPEVITAVITDSFLAQ